MIARVADEGCHPADHEATAHEHIEIVVRDGIGLWRDEEGLGQTCQQRCSTRALADSVSTIRSLSSSTPLTRPAATSSTFGRWVDLLLLSHTARPRYFSFAGSCGRRVRPAARGARPSTSRAWTRVMPAIANDAFIDVRFGKRTGRVREDSRRGGTISELWLTQGQTQTSYWVRSFDDT